MCDLVGGGEVILDGGLHYNHVVEDISRKNPSRQCLFAFLSAAGMLVTTHDMMTLARSGRFEKGSLVGS